MTEDFRKQHAQTVRAIAEKADPITKKRLFDLADRYERKPKPPTPILSAAVASAVVRKSHERALNPISGSCCVSVLNCRPRSPRRSSRTCGLFTRQGTSWREMKLPRGNSRG